MLASRERVVTIPSVDVLQKMAPVDEGYYKFKEKLAYLGGVYAFWIYR